MNNIPEGYKQTEVGVIPQGWEVIKLGDVFDFKNGLNKEKEYFGHGTPIVNYVDVYKNKALAAKDLIGKVTVTKTELKAYEVCKDDVFFTRTSETVDEIDLTSVITEQLEKTVFSGFLLRARPKNNWLDTNYKKYCFSSQNVRKLITSNSSYTTRTLTNGRLLSKVQIPLPPLPEQTAIASALTDVDALITALEQLITKKRNIKQGAMQQLLTGKKRLPGFGGEWEVKKLENITTEIGDGLHSTPQYVQSSDFFFVNGNNFVDNSIKITDNTMCVSENEYNRHKKKLNQQTILLSINGTIGNIAFFNDEKVVLGKSAAYINVNNSTNRTFIFYLLQSSIIKNYFDDELTGTTIRNLSLKTIRNTPILFPLPPEQQAIATILSDMDTEIEALEQKRDKYRALKQGMMQELLTGKTRLV